MGEGGQVRIRSEPYDSTGVDSTGVDGCDDDCTAVPTGCGLCGTAAGPGPAVGGRTPASRSLCFASASGGRLDRDSVADGAGILCCSEVPTETAQGDVRLAPHGARRRSVCSTSLATARAGLRAEDFVGAEYRGRTCADFARAAAALPCAELERLLARHGVGGSAARAAPSPCLERAPAPGPRRPGADFGPIMAGPGLPWGAAAMAAPHGCQASLLRYHD